MDYREFDFTVPVALMVGTELFGVSDAALDEAGEVIGDFPRGRPC